MHLDIEIAVVARPRVDVEPDAERVWNAEVRGHLRLEAERFDAVASFEAKRRVQKTDERVLLSEKGEERRVALGIEIVGAAKLLAELLEGPVLWHISLLWPKKWQVRFKNARNREKENLTAKNEHFFHLAVFSKFSNFGREKSRLVLNRFNLHVRLAMYFVGLFIMTAGIALSVKSNLGVSPVSSIPYTMTCVWGIEMGKATILFHMGLVALQMLLLRKKFKTVNLLQILVGVIFGYFTTLCNWGVGFLPTPDSFLVRIVFTLLSVVLIAVGIFFYMPANVMPLAGEGAMLAVSKVTGFQFHRVKVGFDVSMVAVSLVVCALLLHSLGSVGVGTIVAAFLVGIVLGFVNRHFGNWRDNLLSNDDGAGDGDALPANA